MNWHFWRFSLSLSLVCASLTWLFPISISSFQELVVTLKPIWETFTLLLKSWFPQGPGCLYCVKWVTVTDQSNFLAAIEPSPAQEIHWEDLDSGIGVPGFRFLFCCVVAVVRGGYFGKILLCFVFKNWQWHDPPHSWGDEAVYLACCQAHSWPGNEVLCVGLRGHRLSPEFRRPSWASGVLAT